MEGKYFREYFCSFPSKSYYFNILGVSHLEQATGFYLIGIALYYAGNPIA